MGAAIKSAKPKQAFDAEHLFGIAEAAKERAALALEEAQGAYKQIALATCPYEVNTVVETNKGLGLNGLLISEITAAVTPSRENRWAIETLSYSKSGEITRRGVYIDEAMAADPDLGLRVRKTT